MRRLLQPLRRRPKNLLPWLGALVLIGAARGRLAWVMQTGCGPVEVESRLGATGCAALALVGGALLLLVPPFGALPLRLLRPRRADLPLLALAGGAGLALLTSPYLRGWGLVAPGEWLLVSPRDATTLGVALAGALAALLLAPWLRARPRRARRTARAVVLGGLAGLPLLSAALV